jgi:tRNA-specific 2-thiouridylase
MKKSVLVAMSGGVDSSVAAALLLEQGYEVTGVTMKLWQDDAKASTEGCCSLDAVNDARRVADKLGIPHYVMNLSKEFKEKVIEYFIDEYTKAMTPNPCIACNRYIKWELLLQKALAMGIDYIATGHYAQVQYNEDTKRWLLKRSQADSKDQTYALYNMTQPQLEHTLFPLGIYTNKEKIREIAAKLGLRVANKPDSQEICFVDDNYGDFIEEKRPGTAKPGDFVDKNNRVLGQHKGIIYYTIGQRKGLGIALGKPVYVVGFNIERNQVILGDEDKIFKDTLIAKDINLISMDKLTKEERVTAKIRYSAKPAACTISSYENDRILVKFDEKQRAITPGQSVVFYQDDIVVGGGVIS